jgi:hypothetical protein
VLQLNKELKKQDEKLTSLEKQLEQKVIYLPRSFDLTSRQQPIFFPGYVTGKYDLI